MQSANRKCFARYNRVICVTRQTAVGGTFLVSLLYRLNCFLVSIAFSFPFCVETAELATVLPCGVLQFSVHSAAALRLRFAAASCLPAAIVFRTVALGRPENRNHFALTFYRYIDYRLHLNCFVAQRTRLSVPVW